MTTPDLLIAGAGGGLAGALRAAEHGLRVMVIEASPLFQRGNNTSMSTAMVPAAGSRWQAAAGIDDSPDLYLADILSKTRGEADERVARALAGVSAPLVEWLADHLGVPMALPTDVHYSGHSVNRCHTVPSRRGSYLVEQLTRRVAAEPLVDLLVPARLVDVRTSAGAVCGVVVRYPNGAEEDIPARTVLLATNGYGANASLVGRYLPEIAAAAYHGSAESRGDALWIGQQLGAATAFLDAYQGHAALAESARTLVGWATILHGAVLLDLNGRRFGDETCGYSEYAAALAARPGSAGWIVLDQRIHDACLPFADFRDTVESGALIWADTVTELARSTQLPIAEVTITLGHAGQIARGTRRDRFGRTSWEAPLRPPYAAVKVVPALFHTQGGLVVDGHARVLRADGSAIPGLYAAGGAAAGISGHGAAGYLAGNGLLPALGLSYLAADHVAAAAKVREG